MNRREFLIGGAIAVTAAACGTAQSTTAPETTTPLLTILRSKGYTVSVEHSLDGGTDLIVNGKKPRIIIAGVFIGTDPKRSINAVDNGPLNFDVANYPVPDGIEPTFA